MKFLWTQYLQPNFTHFMTFSLQESKFVTYSIKPMQNVKKKNVVRKKLQVFFFFGNFDNSFYVLALGRHLICLEFYFCEFKVKKMEIQKTTRALLNDKYNIICLIRVPVG